MQKLSLDEFVKKWSELKDLDTKIINQLLQYGKILERAKNDLASKASGRVASGGVAPVGVAPVGGGVASGGAPFAAIADPASSVKASAPSAPATPAGTFAPLPDDNKREIIQQIKDKKSQ